MLAHGYWMPQPGPHWLGSWPHTPLIGLKPRRPPAQSSPPLHTPGAGALEGWEVPELWLCWPPLCAFRTQPGPPAPFNPTPSPATNNWGPGLPATHRSPSWALPCQWPRWLRLPAQVLRWGCRWPPKAAYRPVSASLSAQGQVALWAPDLQWAQLGAAGGSACYVASAGPLPTPSREHLSSPWGDGAHEVWLTLEPQTSCLQSRSHIMCTRISCMEQR